MKFYGLVDVNTGAAKLDERGSMEAYLLSLRGKRVCFDITPVKIKRTLDQNAGYHKLIDFFTIELNKLTGNDFTPEKVKAMVAVKFLIVSEYNKNTGAYMGETLRGTSDLSLEEMSQLIEKVYAYASEQFGITLPELKRIE